MVIGNLAFWTPLLGFFLGIIPYRDLKESVSPIICGLMGMAMLASISLFFTIGEEQTHHIYWQWINLGSLHLDFGLLLDRTSTVMVMTVNVISCLVHIYSLGYMARDPALARFMAYLSLFTFFMLVLVVAPNLVQLFFGWEGVGVCSYLLIGFWHQKPSANTAAFKAFIVNRVGDAGFLIGIAGLFYLTTSLDIPTILGRIPNLVDHIKPFFIFGFPIEPLSFICLAIFLGVMGKSAQLGLHTWLPDAMEGPTPVSALIHAATMVTAGVYLLIRLHPLFVLAPYVQNVIAIIGAATCFFAATVALVQDDIKRIIAYSTCSQLGYMVLAAGLNAVDASFFHLVTHAFFKALLFLGAGSVIHALSDEQNIEKMGGLYKYIPFTYTIMWIGSLALAGIPFFSGFYSKDSILAAAFMNPGPIAQGVFWVALFVAFLTPIYSWRLLLKVFHQSPKAGDRVMAHIHEAPWIMRIPLILLALGATFLGMLSEHFFIHAHQEVPSIILQVPVIVALLGICVAYFFFFLKPHMAFNLSRRVKYLYVFLLNKWFFDKIYNKIFVQNTWRLGEFLSQRVDQNIIDRFGPQGLSALFWKISVNLRKLQTGYLYHYIFAFFIGITAITLCLFIQPLIQQQHKHPVKLYMKVTQEAFLSLHEPGFS